MKDFLCRALKIERTELRKTILVFFLYFFVIFAYYLIKPSKDSLFIQYMGAESMPLAFIIIPLVTLVFLFLYDYLVRKLRRRNFAAILLIFFITNLITIWLMFRAGLKSQAAYTLYVWSDIFSVATVTLFWSITNDIYTSDGARRVYGFLGIGSQLGGSLGSLITRKAASFTETENLLPVSALFIVVIILFIFHIDGLVEETEASRHRELKDSLDLSSKKTFSELYSNFLLVLRSPYLLYFALLLCMMLMCSNLVNYQIGRVMENAIIGKESKTAYMASIYFWANTFSLVFLILAPFFYRLLGVFGTLGLAPVINLITISGFTVYPVIGFITITKILDGSLKYGITQVTREMLYIPCTKEEKYRAKAVIDILFYRLVKIFSALVMIIFTSLVLLSIRQFNVIIIVTLFFTMWVIYRLRLVYIKSIEAKIKKLYDEHIELMEPGEPLWKADISIIEQEFLRIHRKQLASEKQGKGSTPEAMRGSLALPLEDLAVLSEKTAFNEETAMKKLLQILIEKAPEKSLTLDPLSLIDKELILIAPAGTKVYHNEYIEKAILLLSRFHRDSSVYSLCTQYLLMVLPYGARKKYTLLLSHHSPTRRLFEIASLTGRNPSPQGSA
ncbi:MAG: Npt1/Npt2 family nucleotide transporter [Candidatus Eremiobacteraeota bacterium]|nr:Npt1/Npt2 family nucleotide transporter [Candidatus Eremiobacteraeota bacterium]